MTAPSKSFGILVLCAALAFPAAALAHADRDHDQARDLFERGEILSLDDVMRAISARVPGEIVGVSLVEVDEHWVYRFQIVAPDGKRSTVDVDADSRLSHHEAP
jgi:uncharacterized membrane protein YkoI